jgi:RHS repeat-associated protein
LLSKLLRQATHAIMVLLALAGLVLSGSARAQSGEGVIGWVSSPGPSGAFPTAEAACRAQWDYFMNDGYDRFIGATPSIDNWQVADCEWTRYQYLCPQETGAGFACGTIIPNSVSFQCQAGYTAVIGGYCRATALVERKDCNCDESGRANPVLRHPIVVSTGSKRLSAVDYESGDGDFRIGREYRSVQVGRGISGNGLPKSLIRSLAGGWNFDFAYEVQLGVFSGTPAVPNAKVAVLAPDGTGYGFVLTASGQWVVDPATAAAQADNNLKLEFVGTLPPDLATIRIIGSTWRFTDAEDTVWTLVATVGGLNPIAHIARPTQRVRRDGYATTFAYAPDTSLSSITDSFGRTATFSWSRFYITTLASPPSWPEAVAGITLPDGTKLRYTYDPPPAAAAPSTSRVERLIKVERLSAANAVLDSVTYHYEDPRFRTFVTGITDNRGVRIRTYAYDAAGRAITSQGPGGADAEAVAFGTSGTALTRAVTGPLGKVETYTFTQFNAAQADYRLTGIAGAASANTPASSSALSYAASTYIASQTDELGRVTATTARDSRGRPLTVVEASGTALARTTTITWHPTFNVPASIVRPGLTETRGYNALGQITTVTLTDTTSQTVPYSTNGQTRTWTYSWTTTGRLLSINGPLAPSAQSIDDVTTFGYTAQGQLQTVTNALGQLTSYAGHDANGRPASMTDPNGVVTALTYDPLGRVQTVTVQHPTDPLQNAATTLAYDAVGNLVALTLPLTDPLLFDYDAAGRMIALRNAAGERRDFTYDAMGNVLTETDQRGDGSLARQVSRAYDELGRLLGASTGPGRTARWGYDKASNVTSATSPNGFATTLGIDALNRVASALAPDGGATALGYDAAGNLASHTDPRTVATSFTFDGFGEVIQEVSPDRGTSTYWYDAAGALTQESDGRGQVLAYIRDPLGRMLTKTPVGQPASEVVSYTWDSGGLAGSYAVGRLGRVSDGTGLTRFAYDHRGNLISRKQPHGAGTATTAWTYDLADRIAQITYPSGRQVLYQRDTQGRVNLVQTRANAAVPTWTLLASAHTYEPFGPLRQMALGNGTVMTNTWASPGVGAAPGERRLAKRRLTRTSDSTVLSNLAYGYDADDNIASVTNQLGPAGSMLYGYDRMDRLTLAVSDAGGGAGAESFAYTPGTNRLASVTTAAGTRTMGYDARGNTAAETRPGGVTLTTTYDGHGRLTAYSRSDAAPLSFAYNGLDDRVAMTRGTDMRNFVTAPDGRALGEYGATPADVKAEFIWAMPEAASDSPWGGDDGIGGYAPLAVATPDAGGTVVLNWLHGGHLGVPLLTLDASGNPSTTPNDYLLPGFPGQARVLPDLYYNRYRDYDPTTGRYIQADPIGLGGGSNLFAYAGDNPVNAYDPDGLNPAAVRGAIIAGEIAGDGLIWWCRSNIALCLRTIGPTAVRIARACKAINDTLGGDDDDICYSRWNREYSTCGNWAYLGDRAVTACRSRAANRRNLCISHGGRPVPWEPNEWDPYRDWFGEQDDINE